MASLTRWTWVWVNSGSWWWTGRPGVLRFMGSQRVGQDWATDLIWSCFEKYKVILMPVMMVPHSSTLAWKIPWTEEPGGLQSMGSLRVEHDWSDLAAAAAVWRRILKLRFRYFQLQVFTKQAISDCRLTFWFECEISIPFPKCGLILHSSFYWVLNYRH